MRKRINAENKKTLANILLRNYVLTYFVITILVFIILIGSLIIGALLYINIKNFDTNNAGALMKNDYRQIDTSQIEALGGYMEVIDDDHKVIYRKGINPAAVDTYTPLQYYMFFLEPEQKNLEVRLSVKYQTDTGENSNNFTMKDRYVYNAAYNEEERFLLVIAVPENKLISHLFKDNSLTPGRFLVLILTIDFFIIVLVFLLLSKVTSKNFIKPLKLLIEGARQISKGNYSARISLRSKNEFGELRDAFNTMAEEIEKEKLLKEKSEESRKALILDISHDLKNPLSSIMGYSEYITKNSDMPKEELDKYLETIRVNSARANTLIQDLFEYSRLESLDYKLNFKSMDINEFLRNIIASYVPQFERKSINYDFDIPEEKTYIAFDEKQLDRAISNLILNSIKYNPSGTTTVIKAGIVNNSFNIVIEDDGVGIPEELKEDIFQAFVRVDTSRNSQTGGTGLGLAITKKIIDKHGGSISLESDTNKGSKFVIKLPMY